MPVIIKIVIAFSNPFSLFTTHLPGSICHYPEGIVDITSFISTPYLFFGFLILPQCRS